VDDTYTTCYVPLYCGITQVPESFSVGDIREFSWNSAWWVFNFVSNIANLKYSYMIRDIQKVQHELEENFFALQPLVDKTAAALSESNPELMKKYLTDYSVTQGEQTVQRWKQLGEELLTKYNDGYVKDEKGRPRSVGYPEEWMRDVNKLRGDQFKIPVWEKKEE